ncbi:helix-turn-helix domain-containing protein [Mycolicibacillus trivialis]|uniref:AraC family transcriptional regulator n=1 Tax=Mycolicibacillus trivialis TaxID=1798 RepID=A0A1X2EHL4_9MYCO|nr:helix-turn-helix domain-containing protein [Mycolicibacillus trivialis]ORX02419.1 AraC family transcriptional regulator [Mycolicibacillus trivialis]
MDADPAPATPWSGALAVTEGAWCYVGALSDARRHYHVATQIVCARSGLFELSDGQGRSLVTSAAVIASGREHSIRVVDDVVDATLVFLDPAAPARSAVAGLLDSGDDVRQWAAAGAVLGDIVGPAVHDPAMLLDRIRKPADEQGPLGRDGWHPGVRAAVELIAQTLPGTVRLSSIARAVSLSPGRLSRLFNEQVGQSVPTYVRWVRLRLAVESLQCGASLTDAAHAAGFTDSAHANRVCHEMFGLSPSEASRNLVWA